MFDDKGELSVPVVGFMLVGFAALFMGIALLDAEWSFFDAINFETAFFIVGVLLLIAAFFSFKRAFIIEGMLYGIFGIILAAAGYLSISSIASLAVSSSFLGIFAGAGPIALVLCVVCAMLAFMCYRIGELYILLMSVFAIVAFLPLSFVIGSQAAVVLSAIGFFLVGAIALYYTIMDWMLVQDIAEDIADFMYGDDDECGCGCGCEEHVEKE